MSIAQAITDRKSEIDRLQAEIKALTDVEQDTKESAPQTTGHIGFKQLFSATAGPAIGGVVGAVVLSIFAYFLILPTALADQRTAQAATAYADFVDAFFNHIGASQHAAGARYELAAAEQASALTPDNEDVRQAARLARARAASLPQEIIEGQVRYMAARTRIGIYGSPATVEAVSILGGSLDESQVMAFVTALEAFREHLGAEPVDREHLRALLLNGEDAGSIPEQ